MYKVTTKSGQEFDIKFEKEGFVINDKRSNWDIIKIKDKLYQIIFEGKSFEAELLKIDEENKIFFLKINNKPIELKVENDYDRLLKQLGMDKALTKKANELKAPMPGLVLRISVEEGQTVKQGDSLLVLEAMKMENVLKSSGDGKIKSIKVKPGDKTEKGQLLIVME
ncbi:MAG TPA: acetyl-CoA carboxylase biotin carboxyl carrier protein subunit [Bacteroidetes bacterium]|nr:acetyl-CoA carboxylase biotin carboxyl carrier protein subunit [Bacteroidota bacterium]